MKDKVLRIGIFVLLFIAILNIKNVVGAFSYTYDNYEYDFGDVEDAEMYSYITVWVCGTSSKDCSEIYGVISSKPVEFTYIDNSTFEFGLSGAYNGSYHSYYIPSKNVLFGGVNKSFHGSGYNVEILYTNYDLYDTDGTLIHTSDTSSSVKELLLYKSVEGQTTTVPITIYSQDFYEENVLNYNMQYYDNDKNKWIDCNVRSINDLQNNIVKYQFYLDVYKNCVLEFRLLDETTGEYYYNNITVDNIVITQDSYGSYINGEFMPTPWFDYEYISDTNIKLYSQIFTEEEINKLNCSYGKDLETDDLDNEEKWVDLGIESSYSEITRSYEYRFVLYVDNSNYDADGEYFFRFYLKESEEYTYSSVHVTFDEIIKYNNSLNKEETNRYIALFRDRLGFLFYPFDLFISIFDHLSNINFAEPVVSIPDIYEPSTNVKIISAINFNFNDLLKNDVLKNVHDVYLILVDGFVVFSLSNLLYKKLMEVLGNG